MSQRECSGFNAPGLSVEASDDVAGFPMTACASWVSPTCANLPVCLSYARCPGIHGFPWASTSLASVTPGSVVAGERQPQNFTACSKLAVCFRPSTVFPVASIFSMLTERPPLGVHGVGHPVKSLSDVRGADAVCAQYSRPDRVAIRLQVCRYSIEPIESNRLRNLLPKDSLRMELGDKPTKDGPEVAIIACAFAFPSGTEWLAGTRACPNRSSGGPSSKFKGEGPSADSGEEVALSVV